MADCSACGAVLDTPLGCETCGVVLETADPGPFVVFGIAPTWNVDADDLKRRLRRFGRVVHPDFHTADPAQRELAERATAQLNRAFEVLLDPFRRADWLIERLGGPSEKQERQMPQAFLMEVLEWNEALDEAEGAAPDSPARARLDTLAVTLNAEHARLLQDIGATLTPLPQSGAAELAGVRQRLNAVRYLGRTLYRIRDLRFGSEAT
jgi:molecular chaperone HscB